MAPAASQLMDSANIQSSPPSPARVSDSTHRHREAAPLAFGRSIMPLDALQLMADGLSRLEEAGFGRPPAAHALIAVIGHAYGYALMEINAQTCGRGERSTESEAVRIRRVAAMFPRDVPERLFEAGLAICGSDTDASFAAGIDLLVDGMDTHRTP